MKWTVAFAAALAASGYAQNVAAQSNVAPKKSWSSTLDENCRRCVSSKPALAGLPAPLPKRAIIYGFTGEFARQVDTWVVNLDTGEIINFEAVSNNSRSDAAREWKRTTNHLGTVKPDALERLRASAAALWASKPFNGLIYISPGTMEQDEVISGSRLVAFSRFASRDHDIVAAVNSALPADAAIPNGSFVVPSSK